MQKATHEAKQNFQISISDRLAEPPSGRLGDSIFAASVCLRVS